MYVCMYSVCTVYVQYMYCMYGNYIVICMYADTNSVLKIFSVCTVSLYVSMYVCMHVFMYVCMYVCMAFHECMYALHCTTILSVLAGTTTCRYESLWIQSDASLAHPAARAR